jgi:hypothetical protein
LLEVTSNPILLEVVSPTRIVMVISLLWNCRSYVPVGS